MKAYQDYKDSGIQWLGSIPKHWEVKKLKYAVAFSKGLSITKENLEERGIPCVNYGEIHSKYGFKVMPQKVSLKCVSPKYKAYPQSIADNGDFIFADTSEDIDGSGNFTLLEGDKSIFAGYHTIIVKFRINTIRNFIAYLFDSIEFRKQIRKAVKGVKVYSITQSILKEASIWLPPLSEQEAIASYLDKKTQAIGQAIGQCEQLIALLKEQRQALIQQVVTKGLDFVSGELSLGDYTTPSYLTAIHPSKGGELQNGSRECPNVENNYQKSGEGEFPSLGGVDTSEASGRGGTELKDSGIEWLGQIPKHWELKPGFQVLYEVKNKNANLQESKVLSLSYGNIIVKPKDKLVGLVPESFETYQIVEIGDIIIRTTDLQNDKTSLRTGLVKDRGIITSAYLNLRCYNNSKFYHYYLHTIDVNKVIYGLGSGLRQNISFLDFKRFSFVVPPLSEQEAIASYLDKKTEAIDKAIGLQEQKIAQLKAYQTSLINEVVTGKVKVS